MSALGDDFCDEINDNYICGFDMGDCVEAPPNGYGCSPIWNYADGMCHDQLNTLGCNFDGGDCCNNNAPFWKNYCDKCECNEGKITPFI
jgi:hypothetical protein